MSNTVLKPHSVGTAGHNLEIGSKFLKVIGIEVLSGLDGQLNIGPQESVVKGQAPDGSAYEVKGQTDLGIIAEWLPMGSNRVTPPNIRRGELVMLYRLGDSDKFYWSSCGLRDHLRRLETVVYAFNANPNNSNDELSVENCYFLEISTHKKAVTLSTSTKNGEPYSYTIQLDTSYGRLLLVDDQDNKVVIDTPKKQIMMENTAGTKVELIDRDTNISMLGNMTVDVGGNLDITVKGNTTCSTTGNSTTTVTGNETTNITGNETRTVTGNSSTTVTGPRIEMYGATYAQTVSQAYAVQVGAVYEMTAPLYTVVSPLPTFSGILAAQDLKTPKTNYNDHVHMATGKTSKPQM